MKTSKQLIEERSTFTAKIAELSAKETLTDAEQTELRNAMTSEEKLHGEVELALQLEKRNAEQAALEARKMSPNGKSDSEKKEMRNFSFGNVINSLIENKPLSGLEKELADESMKEARSKGFTTSGIYLSESVMNVVNEKRAMSAGSATGGGNTIQTDKNWAFDALYAKRVLQALGVIFETNLSNNVDLTGFGTGATSSWGTETAELADGSPTTAYRPLTPHRLGTYIPMSKQLLIQNPQLEGRVLTTLMESIYATVEAAYINGTDADGQPLGLLGTPNIQNVAIGTNGDAPTLPKMLELVQKLGTANATVENLKFLINPKVEAKLKQTEIGSGSGAMIMSYQNYFTGTPGVIDGKITAITSNVPSNLDKGSSTGVCSAIICGDFQKSVLAQFGGMDVTIDPYTLARTGQVRIVANTFWDMAFTKPEVFGAILDATTT